MEATAPLTDPAPRTFFGVPSLRELDMLDAQVAFLGVPYDGGKPEPRIPTGQRAGPAAAREATQAQFYYPRSTRPGGDRGAEGWYDVEADRDYLIGVTMADVGDVAIQGSDAEANYERITGAARRIAEQGALMVAIGGDHSISYPLGRGMEPFGQFDVVHVDAHADFLDELNGSRLTGASQLRRLAELPFVGTVTALGVRNVDRAEVDGMRKLGDGGRPASMCSTAGRAMRCVRRSPRQGRSTSRSTSTCSILRSRPGTRCRSRAGSATGRFARSWSKSRDVGA
ncbi:MAG: hypothetical protein AUG48_06930 [Actinobacteria bacterium 13_1_20CM_3_68_9]|nr:MAG: hypothetical protein AUG48_06930 [Actinobacteria bacterium 13_1_20CM_3_68_9]